MNIADYVKFDERAEDSIRKYFAKKINRISVKYAGCGPLAVEQVYEIEKELDKQLNEYRNRNLPPEWMLPMYAIEWGEANPGMNFSKAMIDCYNYCKLPIEGVDLLDNQSITIEEAKELYNYSNNKTVLSSEILDESLRILRNDSPRKNSLTINSYKCNVEINNEEHEIPSFWIKYIIAKYMNPEKKFTPEEYLSIKDMKLPTIYAEWPSD